MNAEAHKAPFCKCCGVSVMETRRLRFGGNGNSVFNYIAEFIECKKCGSCFFLGLNESQIADFYITNESGYIGDPQFDSNDVVNTKKYQRYLNFVDFFSSAENIRVCDIGCGGGGFLNELANDKKYSCLVGVDYDVSLLKKKFKHTSIEWFSDLAGIDKKFDVITAFHVLEHIVNVDLFVLSLKKLMHSNSTLIFEVPNKARYWESSQGILYWYAIREHLNHFTAPGLKQLLLRQGMQISACVEYEGLAPNCPYPALLVAARLAPNDDKIDRSEILLDEVARCCEELQICSMETPVTVWGLSQIAMLCIANLDNRVRNILSLIDNVHAGNSFRDIEIEHGRGPKYDNETLVIFECASKQIIYKEAKKLGWNEEQVRIIS